MPENTVPERAEIQEIWDQEEKEKKTRITNKIKERWPNLEKQELNKISSDLDSYFIPEEPETERLSKKALAEGFEIKEIDYAGTSGLIDHPLPRQAGET